MKKKEVITKKIKKEVRNLFGKKETLEGSIKEIHGTGFDAKFKLYKNEEYTGFIDVFPHRYMFKIIENKTGDVIFQGAVDRKFTKTFGENYYQIVEKYFFEVFKKYF